MSNHIAGASQIRASNWQSSVKTNTMSSVSNIKGLFHVTKFQLAIFFGDASTAASILSNSASCNCWFSSSLANRLRLNSTALKFTIKGIGSKELTDINLGELTV